MALLWLFTTLGLLTLASALYRLVLDAQRARRIRRGETRAAEILDYLDLRTYEELDVLRRRVPDLLEVLPGLSGAYANVEFRYNPWRLANHRPWSPNIALRSIPAHALCLALIALAWTLGHTRALGWTALLAALAIELLRWAFDHSTPIATIVSMVRDLAANAPASPAPSSPDAHMESEPTPHSTPAAPAAALAPPRPWPKPDPAAIQFTTLVLLRHAWRPAAQVLYASLRRCGQRDAFPPDDPSDDGVAMIRVGHATLYVRSVGTRVDAALLAGLAPLAIFGDADPLEDHTDHLIVTTALPRVAADAPAAATALTMLRLHARTHRALAEFAPAVAAIWPRVRRRVSADRFQQVADAEPFPMELFDAHSDSASAVSAP